MVIHFSARSNHPLLRLVRVLEWRSLGQLLPWLVCAVSLFVTYQLWTHEQQNDLLKLQTNFDSSVRDAEHRIEERMADHEQMLLGVRGLFVAAKTVNRGIFNSYIGALHLKENFADIQGLGFVSLVPAAQKNAHIAEIRKEGFPEYSIKPECKKELCAPTIYLEPFNRLNLRAFGFDNFTEPVRRIAMEQARDSNSNVISGKVLLQETDGHVRAGFLMYLPVYKNDMPQDTLAERRLNLVGWVYSSFRMEDVMTGVRGENSAEFDLEIHDGDNISDESLMHDSDASHSHLASDSKALFRSAQRMTIANHYWTLAAHSLPAYDSLLEGGKSQFIPIVGLGASLLLTLLTWLLVYGRARALQDAQEISQSEARYRQMFEENASVAYLLDPDTGHIVDANTAALAFWGYTLEELRNMNIAKISIAPSEGIIEVMSKIKQGATHRMEMLHRIRSGEIRDVEVFSGPLTYEGKTLRYSIVHDITTRKRAEDELRLSSTVLSAVNEGVLVTDSNNNIVTVNPSFTAITGYCAEEVIGKNPRILSSGKHPSAFYQTMWETLLSTGSWQGEIQNRRKTGEYYVQRLSITLVRDERGGVSHHVGVFSA